MFRIKPVIVLCVIALAAASPLRAHSFPERAEPLVGVATEISPTQVRIWFDGAIEPAFSTLRVLNERGQLVNMEKSQVNADNPRLLEARVAPLPAGTYRVVWNVVARDGHRTQGDYVFTIKNK
ncbi:MAG: copper resistance CopC family protein [Burkholderiales bacterium]